MEFNIPIRSGIVDAVVEVIAFVTLAILLIPLLSWYIGTRVADSTIRRNGVVKASKRLQKEDKRTWGLIFSVLSAGALVIMQLGINGETREGTREVSGIHVRDTRGDTDLPGSDTLAYADGRAENTKFWRDCLRVSTSGDVEKEGELHVLSDVKLELDKDKKAIWSQCGNEELASVRYTFVNLGEPKCGTVTTEKVSGFDVEGVKGSVLVEYEQCDDRGYIRYVNPTWAKARERYMEIVSPVSDLRNFRKLYEKLTPGGLGGVMNGWAPANVEHINIMLGWLGIRIAWDGTITHPKIYLGKFTRPQGTELYTTVRVAYLIPLAVLVLAMFLLTVILAIKRPVIVADIGSPEYFNALWANEVMNSRNCVKPDNPQDLILADCGETLHVTLASNGSAVRYDGRRVEGVL